MPKPFPTNIESGPGQGASGKPGPQGPEGPGFVPGVDLTGNQAQQAVIGLRERPISADPPAIGNVYAWDGVKWAPIAISSGGGTTDFTNTHYVDAGTTGSQTGSSENPFATITQAAAAITSSGTGGLILVTPGNYSSEAAITINQNIIIVNLAGLVITTGSYYLDEGSVYLPSLIGSGLKNIQGCTLSGAVSSEWTIYLTNCDINSSVNSSGDITAFGCQIRTDVTTTYGSIYFNNCRFWGPFIYVNRIKEVHFYNCDISYSGSQPNIIFEYSGGSVYVDATTWYHFKLHDPSSSIIIVNGIIKLAGGIGSEGSDSSSSNTSLTSHSSTAIYSTSDFGKWFAPSSDYAIVLGVRILFWQPSDKTNTGFLDMTVCMHITTDSSGVATVELKSAINTNSSYLPTVLSTAAGTIAATSGGFTISAIRPTTVIVTARAKWWFASAELLA